MSIKELFLRHVLGKHAQTISGESLKKAITFMAGWQLFGIVFWFFMDTHILGISVTQFLGSGAFGTLWGFIDKAVMTGIAVKIAHR